MNGIISQEQRFCKPTKKCLLADTRCTSARTVLYLGFAFFGTSEGGTLLDGTDRTQ